MSGIKLIVAACVAGTMLVGCGDVTSFLGQEKRSPDEFAVYQRAPLSLPPDYGLRPPVPGTARTQGSEPEERARKALRGGRAGRRTAAPPRTPGESRGLQAFTRRLGVDQADPDIRAVINRETTFLAEEDKTVAERIMFWGTPTAYGSAVDPQKESRRLRENQALGRPITEGDVPVIERKNKALLEGIFD